METTVPNVPQTLFAQATVGDNGSLHLKDPDRLALKPGDEVALTISPVAPKTEAAAQSLLGTVTRYEDPFGPAVDPDDWDALRSC
jgi:hypothetical protein